MIHIITKTSALPGPEFKIDCPNCNQQGAVAKSADLTAREYLWGIIPVTTSRWTSITCTACGRSFRAPLSCAILATMTSQEISVLLAHWGMAYVGNITKFCVVLSLVFCPLPFFGLGCAIAGFIGTRNTRSGWRTAARVAFAIAIVVNAGAVLLLIFERPA